MTVPGIRHIDFKAFGDCTDLKTIVLSEGVASVELGAFWGADQLTDLYLPQTLRSFSADSLPVKSEKVILHVDYVQGGWRALQRAGFILKKLPKELFEQHAGLFIGLKLAYKRVAKLNLHVQHSENVRDKEFAAMPIDCTVTFHDDIKSKYLFQRSMPSQIVVEEGVSYIDPDAFLSGGQFFLDDTNIEQIRVAPNEHFYDVDGVLFSKDHKLLRFPQARLLANNTYSIPDTCTAVVAGAFAGSIGIENIYIPTDTALEQDALAAMPKLDKVFREVGG